MLERLSFGTLREADRSRLSAKKYEKCKDWTAADWMLAMVGEVGELANILKKVSRGDFPLEAVKEDVAKELADVQIYLDHLAMKLDIDLGEATRAKFNEVSDRIGAREWINDADSWRLRPLNEFCRLRCLHKVHGSCGCTGDCDECPHQGVVE